MFTKGKRTIVETKPKFVHVQEGGAHCRLCGDEYPLRRYAMGYKECLACSKEQPVLCNMPLHKQGYTFTRNVEDLGDNQYKAH